MNCDCPLKIEQSQVPGEQLYLDFSSIKDISCEGSKFWVLIVDDYRDYSWSIFLKSKCDPKNKIFTLLIDSKISGIDVKFIRCDGTGENKSSYDSC
jgi:hypothetical protein